MRAMEFETAASTVDVVDDGVQLRWSDGARSRFHALWLRDNCPTGGVKGADGRTYSVARLDPDLVVVDAAPNDDGDLEIEFSDGHVSAFDFDWLRSHSYETHDRPRFRIGETFRSGDELQVVTLPSRGSEGHLALLEAVNDRGAVLVDEVPPTELGTETLAALIGQVRQTDGGRVHDLVVEPEVWEVSQAGLALSLIHI